MNWFTARFNRSMWNSGLAAAFACLAVLEPSTTARGQCLEGHAFASDAAAADQFGSSVAISGDTAVVGAQWDNTPGGTDAGSAYVYVRANGVWILQAHLFASDGAANDEFGAAVSIFGDTAIVGARLDNALGGSDAGSAYVFVRSGGVWTQQAHLFASDGAADDNFGWAVAISGDTVLVAAPWDNTPVGADAGSAYVFVRSGNVWTEQAHFFASDDAAGDLFGYSVAISEETAVVGAEWDNTPGGSDAGSAYVFVRSGSVWTEESHLVASDGAAFDNFGGSVAISGDTVIVGAPFDDTPGGFGAGSAYVFARSGVVWTEKAHLFAFDGAAGDRFGYFVAISGDTAVVGAYLDNTPVGSDAGSAYVFELGCTPGDMNCDDELSLADVDGFVLALVDQVAYSLAYPTCCAARADMNQDLLVNGRDTQAFVAALLAQ